MKKMMIGELSKKVGLPQSTIRYYEHIGLLINPIRINGQRVYENSVIERIMLIKFGKRSGYTLTEIGEMVNQGSVFNDQKAVWQSLAPKKIKDIEGQIAQLEKAKILLETSVNCNCRDLSECLTT